MAPWPSQKPSSSRHDLAHQVSARGVLADTSSSDHDLHPPTPNRKPAHSRSMSNPFPSLFKKKKAGSATEPTTHQDNKDHAVSMAPRQDGDTQKRGTPMNGREFATGTCMTCGATVRWPKELNVFKCTICVTINDLSPLKNLRVQSGSSAAPANRNTSKGTSSHRPTAHLSLDYSNKVIRQSIHRYLSSKLCKPRQELLSPKQGQPQPSLQTPDGRQEKNTIRNPPESGKAPSPYVSTYVFDEEPTLHPNPSRTGNTSVRSHSTTFPEKPSLQGIAWNSAPRTQTSKPSRGPRDDPKWIFKQVEDYLLSCFSSFNGINASFYTRHPRHTPRVGSESWGRRQQPIASREPRAPNKPEVQSHVYELDPKLLLLGDFAENGTWWAGAQEEGEATKQATSQRGSDTKSPPALQKSPLINWDELASWYTGVINAAQTWFNVYEGLSKQPDFVTPTDATLQDIEKDLLQAQDHLQRVLLKATENFLKRPGGRITEALDLRFLFIIAENPLFSSHIDLFSGLLQPEEERRSPGLKNQEGVDARSGPLFGHHSGIIKRIVGLISNAPDECHNQIITWLSRTTSSRFKRSKDLIYEFLSYRMVRQSEKKQETKIDVTAGLIPELQTGRSGVYLHDEMKKPKSQAKKAMYSEDWQIRSAARVLSLWFAANNVPTIRRSDDAASNENLLLGSRGGGHSRGHLQNSDFYHSMVDNIDLIADFEMWESRRGKFTFCQYPFLLSIWAKTQILEHDARRQMESKARDAFFNSIMTRRTISQYLTLDVRRDCLVDDSLQAVSEVIGSGSEDIKKGLRISFRGEEGIDGGGLRKEWFLLLIREVFNPDHGMFIYDEDSQYCYFNPNSFETSDSFFLVGALFGLAIYNSTILDAALPGFVFKKLLAAAPANTMNQPAYSRKSSKPSLEDLFEYRPRLAQGLKKLLDYDGDVEATFCLDFAIDVDRYDTTMRVPLCPGGESRAVTTSNRREYVDLYVRYILETSVARQFEPFKRGFYTVCGGNAFSLFRPEEIELLIRGSDESLDISTLRAVAVYDNWETKQPDGSEPVVSWFWELFQEASPKDQRKLLSFITGSDRLPATGASMMPIKLSCLGEDPGRYPIARTCFNMLSLSKYPSKEALRTILWRAVYESEGFWLK
ncbi:unnamed protein product [Clonostachys solani]|uniref:HECT-type E3 ubiquitin transferase n=1 Tax=Clonostachys solani TaxID=160281 RepID=A0A9N9ZQ56_9HYPO|nr:unnamed protein product [Clonostachys solani]